MFYKQITLYICKMDRKEFIRQAIYVKENGYGRCPTSKCDTCFIHVELGNTNCSNKNSEIISKRILDQEKLKLI